jgi:DNA-binding MarR family transcriptional regulator
MPSTARETLASPCNCGALRKASRRVTRLYDEALAPAGLNSSQHALLAELERWSDQPPTILELADALVIDRTTIARNLRPLERDGYIGIRASEVDRRSKVVTLTAAGRKKLGQAKVLWKQAQDAYETALGATQARLLRSQLLAIATNDLLANTVKARSNTTTRAKVPHG